jgi:hypothetical protein
MEISKIPGRFRIDCKRLYLPLVASGKCPGCGSPVSRDFREFGLSYPNLEEPIREWVNCEECDLDIEFSIVLSLDVRILTENSP